MAQILHKKLLLATEQCMDSMNTILTHGQGGTNGRNERRATHYGKRT